MNFTNDTKLSAAWTLAFEPDGRELLVVAVKGTFSIPVNGAQAELAAEQLPLTLADEATGEPGLSAPLYETDFAPRKALCDVLLNGSAYAPKGQPVRRLRVGLRVGSVSKSFTVVGDRVWRRGLWRPRRSAAARFAIMPISYDRAFGGVDASDPKRIATHLSNPVGRGYHRRRRAALGKPLPNTEETSVSVRSPRRQYRPMAFGPLGRSWQPRSRFAGTYGSDWLEQRAPLLPDDFDGRYFQCAPEDQQMPFPRGGEEVELIHLTPEGTLRFRLPGLPMPVLFVPHRGDIDVREAAIDTLVLEPDQGRFTMTWRVSRPLQRDCFELAHVVVGRDRAAHRRAEALSFKRYYPGLAELVRARASAGASATRAEGREEA